MIYNPWFAHVGEDVVVVPFASQPDRYPDLLRALFGTGNIVRALITIPHKSTTPALLDRVSVAARIAGACNAVRRAPDGSLEGDMFDGEGFVLGMQRNGFSARGCSALVVSSGGVWEIRSWAADTLFTRLGTTSTAPAEIGRAHV